MEKPIIMVSSTFYDLKQIRNELHIFIENMGYDSLLSESPAFPINPEMGTLENCRTKVEIYADVMVLIIGGRYGSIDDRSEKSITNLEYIAARNKGIPVYVFIESKIMNYIDIWKTNKNADFSSVVDTTNVFEFIERIRNVDSVWTFSFDVVSNIKDILMIQLAYLFKSALKDRIRLQKSNKNLIYNTLCGTSLLLVLEKPRGWEYLLFYQVWLDELDLIYEKLYEYQYNIKLYKSESISNENTISWIELRLHEIEGYTKSANDLMTIRAKEAFGPPGVAGDEKEIILVSRNLVKILSAIIDWCTVIRLVKSDEPFTRVITALSKFPENIIRNMQEFPRKSLIEFKKLLSESIAGDTQVIEQILVFDIPNMDEFNDAFEIAKKYYGID